MSKSPPRLDLWRVPAFLLWLSLFAAGLVPERVFQQLRTLGHVKTQSALVNSHYVITLALAAFVGMFTYARCRDAGITELPARGKALQTCVMGLVAFLPVPWMLLPRLLEIPKLELRLVVVFVCAAKLLAWSYLLSVLFRYYFWNGYRAYWDMFMVLPSMHEAALEDQESDLSICASSQCQIAAPGDSRHYPAADANGSGEAPECEPKCQSEAAQETHDNP